MRRCHAFCLSSLAAVLVTGLTLMAGARAQQRPNLPSGALPDIRLQQLAPLPAPQLAPEIPVPETAPARVPAGAEAVRLVFGGFIIDGTTAYPPGKLEAIWQPEVGREITLAEVYRLARDVQQTYRAEGYFLSRVIIPEQRVRDGRFTLRVLEGYIDAVTFEGDVGPAQGLIAAYFEPVTRERPIRLATLERALLLANDVPGVHATALLRSSAKQPGAADLLVTADRRRFAGMLSVDNEGDDFTGEWEASANVSANALTALGEQLTVTGFASEPWNTHAEEVGQASGSLRLGPSGAYLETLASYGDSNPGASLEELDFDSKSLLLSVVAGYPVVRTRDLSLAVRLGFDYINEDTDQFGGQTFSRDRLRVLHVTGRGEIRDSLGGANSGEISLRQGLPVLDATRRSDDDKSRENGTGSATLVRASAARLQPLVGSLAAYGNVASQYAFDHLLSEEQFDLGGSQFGRGYNFSEVSGDDGVGATFELRYSWRPDADIAVSLQPFSFYDVGTVWQRGISEAQTLSSAGVGLRAAIFDSLSIELTMAKPLAAKSQRADDTRDPQFLFRSIGRF
ncbi:MAG: ShlB/FhaC/HecB family hemolysin secretion/activation protein [Rhodospirillales bacterium]|nr:ShlB/FhaC/HecB family hemolysin secretion/activation protein [Rhodospirillales bacterium]